jgi:hypothetical protein
MIASQPKVFGVGMSIHSIAIDSDGGATWYANKTILIAIGK